MAPEIEPVPDEHERRAIVAALAAEDGARAGESAWAEAALPARTDDADDRSP